MNSYTDCFVDPTNSYVHQGTWKNLKLLAMPYVVGGPRKLTKHVTGKSVFHFSFRPHIYKLLNLDHSLEHGRNRYVQIFTRYGHCTCKNLVVLAETVRGFPSQLIESFGCTGGTASAERGRNHRYLKQKKILNYKFVIQGVPNCTDQTSPGFKKGSYEHQSGNA